MSGLNVEKFVVNTALSLLSKLLGSSVTQFTNSSLAETLLSLGNTYETISNIGTISSDSVLNGVTSSFFNSSGLNRVFGGFGLGVNEYESNIRPETMISNSGTTGNTSFMSYPTDLGPYYMSFQFKKYERPAPFVDGTTTIEKSIFLPLPKELAENHKITLNSDDQGLPGQIADSLQLAGVKGTVLNNQTYAAIGAAVAIRLTEKLGAAAGIAQPIEQGIGGAINPIPSVTFTGPTLRTHTFSWLFAPSNQDDSFDLSNILKEIKKRSLPAFAIKDASQFLAYPNIVQVGVVPVELMKFKQGLISDVNINYAPEGIPSFFKGTQAPTMIALDLTILEIEYFTSVDFGGEDGVLGEKVIAAFDQLKPIVGLIDAKASTALGLPPGSLVVGTGSPSLPPTTPVVPVG